MIRLALALAPLRSRRRPPPPFTPLAKTLLKRKADVPKHGAFW